MHAPGRGRLGRRSAGLAGRGDGRSDCATAGNVSRSKRGEGHLGDRKICRGVCIKILMPRVRPETILYHFAPILQVSIPPNHKLQVYVLKCSHMTSLCMTSVISSIHCLSPVTFSDTVRATILLDRVHIWYVDGNLVSSIDVFSGDFSM